MYSRRKGKDACALIEGSQKAEGGGQEVGKCRECWYSQSLEISFGEWLLLQEVNSCSLFRNDLGLGSY